MIEFAVIGAKNSGKTTVIEGLVKYFVGLGYKVATIKHSSHSHRFDTPGKDTYRHRQAGAELTAAIADDEIAIFAEPKSFDIGKLHSMGGQHIDVWIVEGDRNADRPKILITRHLEEFSEKLPENIVATIGPERHKDVPAHFEAGDCDGLGLFVNRKLLARRMETQE
jgi:molybdopterin-guanine dinucleotide biosynthesis protein B